MISHADWLVVACYVALLIASGLRWSRHNSSPEDYFLASRAARWPTIGLALIASNISSTALVGLAGAAFATGISAYNYEWMAALVLVFFCIFLLPQLLHSRVFTMPEFLERRYDARARRWFTVLTLFLNVFVDGAGALYSGALVCRVLIPGAPLWLLSCVLAGAAGIYTIIGGLRAVLRTEVIQAGVLIAGAALVSWKAFARAGGWNFVMTHVAPAAVSLIRPIGDPAVPWPGLLLGVPLLGFYYWCTNQVIVQRTLSARDLDHGRSGALLAGLLKLPVLFLMVFSRYLGVSWKQQSFGIALGLGGAAAMELATLALYAGGPMSQVTVHVLNLLAYNLAILVWFGYAFRGNPARTPGTELFASHRWEKGLTDIQNPTQGDSLIPMFESMVDRAFSRTQSDYPPPTAKAATDPSAEPVATIRSGIHSIPAQSRRVH